jgi:hypothetical protein
MAFVLASWETEQCVLLDSYNINNIINDVVHKVRFGTLNQVKSTSYQIARLCHIIINLIYIIFQLNLDKATTVFGVYNPGHHWIAVVGLCAFFLLF